VWWWCGVVIELQSPSCHLSQQIVTSWRQQRRFNPRISLLALIPKMPRNSVALFLTTVALAGGTVACSKSPEAGEQGGDKDRDRPAMTQPSSPSPSSNKGTEDGKGSEDGKGDEDGKGGEGGEGGEDGNGRKDGKGGKDGKGDEGGEGGEG
jgi:hypothetical protein